MEKDEKKTMWPIYSLLKHGEIDYDALGRDFTWTSVKCNDLGSMFKMLHVIKPTEKICSLKISPRGEEPEVCIMSKLDFDSLLNTIEEKMGRTYVGDHYRIHDMDIRGTPIIILFQLMLNYLGNNVLADSSNAEGRFFKVVTKENGMKGLKGCVSKYIAMEFKITECPAYFQGLSDIYLDYRVVTFNNALREDINWRGKNPKVFTRYHYVDGCGMQTISKEDDGTTFVIRSCYDEKSHLDMLDYTRSTTRSDAEEDDSRVKETLDESRAKVIMEVVNYFNRRLGKYVGGITLCRDEVSRCTTKLDETYEERLMEHFREKRVPIHNLTKDRKYTRLIGEFVETVRFRYGVELQESSLRGLGEYDISVVLPKKAYKGRENEDPYDNSEYSIRQHVTTETLEDALKSYEIQKKRNQTAYDKRRDKWLKDSIGRRQENYPEKGPTPANMPLAEVLLEQLYIKEEIENERIEFFKWADENYEGTWEFAIPLMSGEPKKCTGYATIAIEPDGRMAEPVKHAPSDPFGPADYSRIDWEDVEYAVKDPSGHVNVVRVTGITTIPDAERIMEILKENKSTGRGRTVGLKDKENLPALFGGSIDIGYREIGQGRWIYYVGQMNMKMTVANASVIREIEAVDGGEVFFERLFPMMSIPYVKHKQNSVIPFPIKYLTEWCKKLGFLDRA